MIEILIKASTIEIAGLLLMLAVVYRVVTGPFHFWVAIGLVVGALLFVGVGWFWTRIYTRDQGG